MAILDNCIQAASVIKQLCGEKSTVVVADREHYLFYDPGEVDYGYSVGDDVIEGTMMHKTIKDGEKIVAKIGRQESKFGFPYIVTTVPLIEGNQVVGVAALAGSTDIEEKISSMSKELLQTSRQLADVSENLTAGAEQLAGTSQTISSKSEDIKEKIQNTDKIMDVVGGVSDSTHMLGLNAAIEAARAGEMGRGFSVVAEEIRKLAGNSKASAVEINTNLKGMADTIMDLAVEIEKIAALSEEQAASTEQTNASIQQLQSMAHELEEVAQVLIGD